VKIDVSIMTKGICPSYPLDAMVRQWRTIVKY
jgi:hypothetical protein